ncbi:MAG: hypothetical protein QOE97_2724 [Pseudonocardiales bacterium]|jgi:hypothetical protein|nr:hypothetical protein [Pseudonocardiales bacterium]
MQPNVEQHDVPSAWFTIAEAVKDRELAQRTSAAVLGALGTRPAVARLDVHTDYGRVITPDALDAEDRLERLVKLRRLRGTVDLDLSDVAQADLLRRYLAWSINVDLYDRHDQLIANFHDCAYSIIMRLSPEGATQLGANLNGLVTVEPLGDHRQPWPRTPLKHRRSWRRPRAALEADI